MRIRARFFAAYREAVGCPLLEVELPEGSVVSDLVVLLRDRGGPYALLPLSQGIAVNRTLARGDDRLGDGDEVAFLPPVAGG